MTTSRLASHLLHAAVLAVAISACDGKKTDGPTTPERGQLVMLTTTATVQVDGTTQLTYAVSGGLKGEVGTAWTSDNPTIATVNNDGLVLGVSPGVATIHIVDINKSSNNAAATVTVTISPIVHSVTVAPPSATVTVGGTASFTATVNADAGTPDRTVTWSSSNSAIASVSTTGVVTGVAAGSASIIATSNFDNKVSGNAAVTVTSPAFAAYNGTYNGAVTLTGNSGTPGAVGSLPTCQNSSTDYSESIVVSIQSNGTGTVTINDTPTLPRQYTITLPPSGTTATSTGTFNFLGTTVTGTLTITVNGTTVTFRETTQYGACANTYAGTLTKQ